MVNAFTALERKSYEIVGKINSGMKETKVNENIVGIIVLLTRWLLQIEEGYCMNTEDKKHPRIIQFGNKALYQLKIFRFYATEGVDEFIKEKIAEWDFAMTVTEMNKENELFGSDFEISLISIIYKMPIIIFQNESKGLLVVTNTESLYSTFELGDP